MSYFVQCFKNSFIRLSRRSACKYFDLSFPSSTASPFTCLRHSFLLFNLFLPTALSHSSSTLTLHVVGAVGLWQCCVAVRHSKWLQWRGQGLWPHHWRCGRETEQWKERAVKDSYETQDTILKLLQTLKLVLKLTTLSFLRCFLIPTQTSCKKVLFDSLKAHLCRSFTAMLSPYSRKAFKSFAISPKNLLVHTFFCRNELEWDNF